LWERLVGRGGALEVKCWMRRRTPRVFGSGRGLVRARRPHSTLVLQTVLAWVWTNPRSCSAGQSGAASVSGRSMVPCQVVGTWPAHSLTTVAAASRVGWLAALAFVDTAAAEPCPLGSTTRPFLDHPMHYRLLISGLVLTLACAHPGSQSATKLSSATSVCAGYEDILSLADRPLTPCEVGTQARLSRPLSSQWAVDYGGPCQYVDVQVVVDSLGHLEPGSPKVIQTNSPPVASKVVQEMSKAQFVAGRQRSGARVRQVQRFHFASPNAIGRCDR
jgi:hypothetical protein